jgi:hypothetical protein
VSTIRGDGQVSSFSIQHSQLSTPPPLPPQSPVMAPRALAGVSETTHSNPIRAHKITQSNHTSSITNNFPYNPHPTKLITHKPPPQTAPMRTNLSQRPKVEARLFFSGLPTSSRRRSSAAPSIRLIKRTRTHGLPPPPKAHPPPRVRRQGIPPPRNVSNESSKTSGRGGGLDGGSPRPIADQQHTGSTWSR